MAEESERKLPYKSGILKEGRTLSVWKECGVHEDTVTPSFTLSSSKFEVSQCALKEGMGALIYSLIRYVRYGTRLRV